MNPEHYSAQVSVIGTAQPTTKDREYAYRVGKLLGEANAVLICGGLGGVMAEACRGCSEVESGLSVGILKGDKHNGNQYLDIEIPTGMGDARNLPNVLGGHSVVAISGRFGTLSEIAFSIINDRKVFGVDTWDHPKFDFPSDLTPDEAVRRALQVAQE